MSLHLMPKDRQLLLLFGGLFALFMFCIVISMVAYETASNDLHLSTVPQKCHQSFASCTYLKRSGLGNIIFQYASVLGIARTRGMELVLPPDFRLREYFQMSDDARYEFTDTSEGAHYFETKSNTYDDILVSKLNPCFNLTLVGYFQSYKYFEDHAETIKHALSFKKEITSRAEQFISDAYHSTYGKTSPTYDIIYVGIHVRRGDMISPKAIKYGYASPDRDYFLRAVKANIIDYALPEKRQNVLFIVTSDDIPWCEDQFDDFPGTFVFSKNNPDFLDLAILAQCNHTIISSGTFSWWAGYLSGGNVTYYRGFPARDTPLNKAFSFDRVDYYPPHWVGLY